MTLVFAIVSETDFSILIDNKQFAYTSHQLRVVPEKSYRVYHSFIGQSG